MKIGAPNPRYYPANVFPTGRAGQSIQPFPDKPVLSTVKQSIQPFPDKPVLSTVKQSTRSVFQSPLGYEWNRGGFSNYSGYTGAAYKVKTKLPQEVGQMPFAGTSNSFYNIKHVPRTATARVSLTRSMDAVKAESALPKQSNVNATFNSKPEMTGLPK